MNNMPLMLQTMADSLGDTLIYAASDPGGFDFEEHSTYAPTIAAIFSQKWDVVVLQDQSEEPAFPPSQVDTQVYPYARRLDSMIHVNDSCTQTMFLMTWGHADGDPANCPFYPVICTYDGMQERLRESYLQMATDNHAVVAPVGVAWKQVRDSFPSLWLYQSDSTHPLVTGSYLEAGLLYASIFHKKTLNCTYTDGLTDSIAAILQHFADKTVFDSLSQWQEYGHYPYAGFTYTITGSSVAFSDTSSVPAHYNWSFGDGANDTGINVDHTYSNGNYLVTHTATTNCFTEVIKDSINIATATGVNELIAQNINLIKTISGENGAITFILPAGNIYDFLEVYDAGGKCVRKYTLTNSEVKDNFVPGLYIYHAFSMDKKFSYYNKAVVY